MVWYETEVRQEQLTAGGTLDLGLPVHDYGSVRGGSGESLLSYQHGRCKPVTAGKAPVLCSAHILQACCKQGRGASAGMGCSIAMLTCATPRAMPQSDPLMHC